MSGLSVMQSRCRGISVFGTLRRAVPPTWHAFRYFNYLRINCSLMVINREEPVRVILDFRNNHVRCLGFPGQ